MLAQPLTIAERAELFAELNHEMVLAMDTMLKGLIDEQRNPTPRPVVEPAPVAPVAPMPAPAPTMFDDDLDYLEITAHHIMNAFIRGRYLRRSELMDGGFEALFLRIHEALLEMVGQWDMVEIERVHEDLRGG